MEKEYRPVNVLVLRRIAEKHKVTERFVRMCINGERHGVKADAIVKDYRDLLKAVKQVLT